MKLEDFAPDVALSEQGFPYCPLCGHTLFWENDVMATDLGYLPEGTPLDEDYVIHLLSCADCDYSFEIMSIDGQYHLLSAIKLAEEGEEPEWTFTEFAKQIFPTAFETEQL